MTDGPARASSDAHIPGIGNVRITASDKGITGIRFIRRSACKKNGRSAGGSTDSFIRQALRELKHYASGALKSFTVPVDLSGVSGFTKTVLECVRSVPYGTTVSYGQLAAATGRFRASRAVGNGLGKNPVPVIIPCHRVIRADGKPGGYSSGSGCKKRLLKIEGVAARAA